jgi:hypothetical protein
MELLTFHPFPTMCKPCDLYIYVLLTQSFILAMCVLFCLDCLLIFHYQGQIFSCCISPQWGGGGGGSILPALKEQSHWGTLKYFCC